MGKSKELATLTDGLEQNLGTKIVAGDNTSVGGSQVLAAYYHGSGELGTIGGNASSGGLSVGYCVWPKPNTANAYVSSTDIPVHRSAVSLSGTIDMYMGTAQTVTIGSDVSMDKVFSIDSSGRVTMPYQPAFRAHTFTPLTGTGTIIYTVASHNIGSHYNVSNGKFTAPVSGVYHFDFSVLMEATSATDYIRVLFAINGATDTRHGDTLTGGSAGAFTNYNYHSVQMSNSFYLNANDTVEIKNNNPNNNTYQSGGTYGAFSGYLIG